MKSKLSLIGVILVAAFLAGCLGGGGAAVKDCGSDGQCFTEAVSTCTLAKVQATDPGTGITVYGEILGGTPEQCQIYYEHKTGPFIGKSLTCTIGPTIQVNIFTGSGDTCQVCSGSFLDAMGVCD